MQKFVMVVAALLVGSGPIFAQLSAPFVVEDLSTVDAAGWNAIVGQNYQTIVNPIEGGHGAVDSPPSVSLKAAHDGTDVFLRFEWADDDQDNSNRLWTYSEGAWSRGGNEDRLYMMWPIVDGPGRLGQTFAQIGCTMTCHVRDAMDSNAIVPNTLDPLENCMVCHTSAPGNVVGRTPPFEHAGPTAISGVGDCFTCHTGVDYEPVNQSGGDMLAPSGTAFDIWHWKAQRSAPIGLAEDQHAADGRRRTRDGGNVAPDNNDGGVPKYVWVTGTTAVDNTGPLFQSQVNTLLFANQIAIWDATDSEYQLNDGSPVTLAEGVRVNRHILQDQQTDGSTHIKSDSRYSNGMWTVVLTRSITTDESAAKGAAVTDNDYKFDLSGTNDFSFAVTDNSGINHAGVMLETLVLETEAGPSPTPEPTPPAGCVTAALVMEDLSSPGAAGWGAVPAVSETAAGNPTVGGHGAHDALPTIELKAAHDGTTVFLRFEWDDDDKDDQNRLWTYSSGEWSRGGNEDRLYVMWPQVDGPGRLNQTFAEIGCTMTCHVRDAMDSNAIVPNTTDPLENCMVCHTNAPGNVVGRMPPFLHPGPTAISGVGDCFTCHTGVDYEPINQSGGDMLAPTGTAFDIWHWKAQRSAPIGLAEDQHAADGRRRTRDGGNVAPDNNDGGVPKYVWVTGTTAVDNTGPLFQSQLGALLAANQIAIWNATDVEYQLNDGSPVTLAEGVRVNRHILQDNQTDGSTDVKASSVHSAGMWSVVLSRTLDTAESGTMSVSDNDYSFDPNGVNYFSYAVTDNSGINHAGVQLKCLEFEAAVGPTVTPTPTNTPDGPVSTPTPTIPPGINVDVDGSGKIDANDLMWILRFWQQDWPPQ